MNQSVRIGLALLCAAAMLGLLWLGLRPDETPGLNDGGVTAVGLVRAVAGIAAVLGLFLIGKGLLRGE